MAVRVRSASIMGSSAHWVLPRRPDKVSGMLSSFLPCRWHPRLAPYDYSYNSDSAMDPAAALGIMALMMGIYALHDCGHLAGQRIRLGGPVRQGRPPEVGCVCAVLQFVDHGQDCRAPGVKLLAAVHSLRRHLLGHRHPQRPGQILRQGCCLHGWLDLCPGGLCLNALLRPGPIPGPGLQDARAEDV